MTLNDEHPIARKCWLDAYDRISSVAFAGDPPEWWEENAKILEYVFLNPHVEFTITQNDIALIRHDDDRIHYLLSTKGAGL